MSRFSKLEAAKGYLGAFTSLDTTLKARAEAESDSEVDVLLDGFNVDLLTPANVPRDIGYAAEKIAAARYIRLAVAAMNAGVDVAATPNSLAESLEVEGREHLRAIKARGWYRADDGTRVYRDDPTRGGGFGSAELVL